MRGMEGKRNRTSGPPNMRFIVHEPSEKNEREKSESTDDGARCVWWESCHMILMVCHFGILAASTVPDPAHLGRNSFLGSVRQESQLQILNSNLLLFFHYVSFSSLRLLYHHHHHHLLCALARPFSGRLRLKMIRNEKYVWRILADAHILCWLLWIL